MIVAGSWHTARHSPHKSARCKELRGASSATGASCQDCSAGCAAFEFHILYHHTSTTYGLPKLTPRSCSLRGSSEKAVTRMPLVASNSNCRVVEEGEAGSE